MHRFATAKTSICPRRRDCRRSRFFRPVGETLDPRLLLTSDAGIDGASLRGRWFEEVALSATADQLMRYGQQARAEQWIVSLSQQALTEVARPSSAAGLL